MFSAVGHEDRRRSTITGDWHRVTASLDDVVWRSAIKTPDDKWPRHATSWPVVYCRPVRGVRSHVGSMVIEFHLVSFIHSVDNQNR